MIKIKPKYSKNKIKKAGDSLRNPSVNEEEKTEAMDVLSNWRAVHSYPINTFQATLRNKLLRIDDEDALVAQRLKRTPSIIRKLQRFPEMNLARMQDVGGVRAVVKDIKKCRELEKNYRNSRFAHKLVDEKDYIAEPKETGYRGIHLIYKYHNKKAEDYNGLRVELQIRTKLQHAWATSVETMGTFLKYALKSSEGPDKWLKFFSLVGSAFAVLEEENKVPGHEHLTDKETFKKVVSESKRLGVVDKLELFSATAVHITNDKKTGSYHIVVLDSRDKKLSIESYGRRKLDVANKRYTDLEKQVENNDDWQVVLVASKSIEQLEKTYPNYFLDTHEFIKHIKQIERLAESAS